MRGLEVRGLRCRFDHLWAVDGVTLEVAPGSITGLIGPNGAGKSTLFAAVAGFLEPAGGEVWFEGRSLAGLRPDAVARRGLVRTFQVPREFPRLTVLDNLRVAAPGQMGERLAGVWLRGGRVRAEEAAVTARAREVLARVGLGRLADEPAGHLSGGQKKLLELGRALMAAPRLLLLDEPFAGVHPLLVRELSALIRELRAGGLTFFVIEHNLPALLDLADRVFVMVEGRLLAEGPPEAVRRDPRVLDAYLGADARS